MILIIDNYDSFTQNLVQCIGELGKSINVIRNDLISVKKIENLKPTHIIISPGPGHPQEIKNVLKIIKNFAHKIPILGVCLGHQSIGYIYGANITRLAKPIHGKISKILHNNQDLFNQISNPFNAARYHSLIIDKNNLPNDLEITAWTEDGIIMACRHKKYKKLRGIQFHPESLWTNEGKKIFINFLNF
uniref:Anthranilate synthase component 2 n=1 Tax=Antithamnionella ternifolia TaxID=207919 RepID=A0A4D6WJZ4_9FLOR|nr:Anthranilate synthase component II [Antithamnionella ternifolia]